MKLVSYMQEVEERVVPLAKENTEYSYYRALRLVTLMFKNRLTLRQVTDIVHRVWRSVHEGGTNNA